MKKLHLWLSWKLHCLRIWFWWKIEGKRAIEKILLNPEKIYE